MSGAILLYIYQSCYFIQISHIVNDILQPIYFLITEYFEVYFSLIFFIVDRKLYDPSVANLLICHRIVVAEKHTRIFLPCDIISCIIIKSCIRLSLGYSE